MTSRATAPAESQPSLFEPGQQHSSLTKRAADRRRVLAWYAEHTGTRYECAIALGMLYTTALPRATELKNAGMLMKIPGVPRKDTGLGGTSAPLIITRAGRAHHRELNQQGKDSAA